VHSPKALSLVAHTNCDDGSAHFDNVIWIEQLPTSYHVVVQLGAPFRAKINKNKLVLYGVNASMLPRYARVINPYVVGRRTANSGYCFGEPVHSLTGNNLGRLLNLEVGLVDCWVDWYLALPMAVR